MSLKDIRFQDRAVEFLKTSMEKGRISHSLLFAGPRSVGKSLTAATVAKALNCEAGGPADSCDNCVSCRKIDSLNHPDIHWIRPEGPGNKIRIERTRAMKTNIGLKPFEGRAKVFIIEDAHLLADEAANSMLKTLEEPPKNSFIILITDDLNKIFSTLRSRCQWVLFSSARPDELRGFLMDKHDLSERDAHFLSHLSEGRIGKAIAMKDEGALGWKNDVVDRFTENNIIFQEDPFFFNNKREKILDMMDVLASWYRDIFILSNGADPSLVVNMDRLEELKSGSASLPKDKIKDILHGIIRARSDISRNVNPKLVLCDLVCRMQS